MKKRIFSGVVFLLVMSMLLSSVSVFAAAGDFHIITPYAMADAEFQSGAATAGTNNAIKQVSGTITPMQEDSTDNWFLQLTRASGGARFFLACNQSFPASPVAQRWPGLLFGVMHYEFDFKIPTVAATEGVAFELYDSAGPDDGTGWFIAPSTNVPTDHRSAVIYTFAADTTDNTKIEMRAVDATRVTAARVLGGLVPGTWYTIKGDINNSKRAHQFSIYPRGESTVITGGANINSPLRMHTGSNAYTPAGIPRSHIGALRFSTSNAAAIFHLDNIKTVRDRFYCATPGVALADYFVTSNRPEEKPLLVKDDSAKTFTASIDIYNESFDAAAASETPLLLLAIYDAVTGALVALDTGSEEIAGRPAPPSWGTGNQRGFQPSKATTTVTVDVSALDAGSYKAKAFVWNNHTDIKPYTAPSVEQTLVIE